MLCDYLRVELVELDEVRVAQAEVTEQLRAFDPAALKQKILLAVAVVQDRQRLRPCREGLAERRHRDRAALERVALVLGRDANDDDAVVLAIVENASDLLLAIFVEEQNDPRF